MYTLMTCLNSKQQADKLLHFFQFSFLCKRGEKNTPFSHVHSLLFLFSVGCLLFFFSLLCTFPIAFKREKTIFFLTKQPQKRENSWDHKWVSTFLWFIYMLLFSCLPGDHGCWSISQHGHRNSGDCHSFSASRENLFGTILLHQPHRGFLPFPSLFRCLHFYFENMQTVL